MALSRFEQNWDPEVNCEIYFLDLIQYRSLSNKIAEITGVEHQSPQVIVVSNGKVIYSESHSAINAKEILERIN
jgi:bacillithiol system protein YtxJ